MAFFLTLILINVKKLIYFLFIAISSFCWSQIPSVDIKTLEGEIINTIQKNLSKQDSIIINAGGYSHTSIAISDCLRLFQGLIYEVHISNIYSREKYRRYSYLSDISSVVICGLGFLGYEIAVDLALTTINE